MKTLAQVKTYTPLERNMYLVSMFGQNVFFNVIAVFTTYYMTNVLYVPALMAGVILVIAQCWDALNDPIFGTIMDRTRTKIGKARPYLMVAPFIVSMFTIICFSLPTAGDNGISDTTVGILAACFYICWGMSYTMGDTPLWGTTSLMTEDKKDQEKIQSLARMVAGIGGALPLLAFQPIALAIGEKMTLDHYTKTFPDFAEKIAQWKAEFEADLSLRVVETFQIPAEEYVTTALHFEKRGFIIAAVVFTIIAAVAFQMVSIFVKEKIAPSEKKNGLVENYKVMMRNKPFRQVFASGVLSSTRNITMIVALPMVTLYFAMKDPGAGMLYMVLLGGPLFGGMFVAMALVPKLSEKFGKKHLYNASNLMEILPNLAIFGLFISNPDKMGELHMLIPLMFMFLLKGVCLGLFNVLQTNMISDAIDYEDYTNRVRPDGAFFSGQTFMVKIGMGFSNIIWMTGLCAMVGYSGDNIRALNDMVARISTKLSEHMGSDFFGVITRFFQNGMSFPQTEENIIHTAELLDSRTLEVVNTVSLTADQLHMYFAIMFFAISILPAIANILAVIPTWNYYLTEEKRQEVVRELQKRRREEGTILE
ncbi:MAG: MFS transporter [Oscillospiraceae bacterium]|nr:MFS transporter [Oscillospiraceae bacterium]